MFRFKVCCIKNVNEANLAIDYGASTLGLVSQMPSGPGPIPIDLIRRIAEAVKGQVQTWVLTSKTTSREIINEYQQVKTDGIQLVDEVPEDDCREIKLKFPHVHLVQVRHVQKNSSAAKLSKVNPYINTILLDSGSPNNAVKILGGTGNVHDWNISQDIISHAQVPVYLAGGLHPNNALAAIRDTKPHGLDVCSGLRTNGYLDPNKLKRWSDILARM
jgi:phosphoribosylanthranilate isomerase